MLEREVTGAELGPETIATRLRDQLRANGYAAGLDRVQARRVVEAIRSRLGPHVLTEKRLEAILGPSGAALLAVELAELALCCGVDPETVLFGEPLSSCLENQVSDRITEPNPLMRVNLEHPLRGKLWDTHYWPV